MFYPQTTAVDPIVLTKDLVKAIYAIPGVEGHSNTAWTVHVREILKELAPSNCVCHFTDKSSNVEEFLVDVMWKSENGRESMALAAESEWGNPWVRGKYLAQHQALEIGKDFAKLLVLKTPIKLMIFASDQDKTHNAILSEIARHFDNYADHISGERYVFIDLAQLSRRTAFIFETINQYRPLLENLAKIPLA